MNRKPATKFGIFYELQPPRPPSLDGERLLYQNAPTQVEMALGSGFEFVARDRNYELRHRRDAVDDAASAGIGE
jgi:hypothetical protein